LLFWSVARFPRQSTVIRGSHRASKARLSTGYGDAAIQAQAIKPLPQGKPSFAALPVKLDRRKLRGWHD
jgi:hypothetical protein